MSERRVWVGHSVATPCHVCGEMALEVTPDSAVFYCSKCEASFHGPLTPPPGYTGILILPDPPDPDTGDPDMTFDAPTAGAAVADLPAPRASLERGHETITARTPSEVTQLIRKANANAVTRPYLQKAKGGEGTGTLGLYLEAVVFASNGTPFTHMKFFVVNNHVYAYNRSKGDTRANWRHRATPSLEAALTVVQRAIDKTNVRVFGHPVLVELQPDDISAIESGGMPPARFRGQYRVEKDYGRYDFEMDVVTAPLPSSLVAMLRHSGLVDIHTAE